MSVTDTAPAMTPDQFNARVRDYVSGLGFASQADVATAFGNIVLPPVPYNVPQSVITVGNGVLAGLRADRALTFKGYAYRLISLTGVNAGLSIELRKNGVAIPGSAVNVDAGNLTAMVVLGNNVPLVLGDTVELWRTGLLGTAPVPGGMYGTFMIA